MGHKSSGLKTSCGFNSLKTLVKSTVFLKSCETFVTFVWLDYGMNSSQNFGAKTDSILGGSNPSKYP